VEGQANSRIEGSVCGSRTEAMQKIKVS